MVKNSNYSKLYHIYDTVKFLFLYLYKKYILYYVIIIGIWYAYWCIGISAVQVIITTDPFFYDMARCLPDSINQHLSHSVPMWAASRPGFSSPE